MRARAVPAFVGAWSGVAVDLGSEQYKALKEDRARSRGTIKSLVIDPIGRKILERVSV